MGYEIVKIHEAWHFGHEERGLFSQYVNTWLKIKQESAGYPSWYRTAEDKECYVNDYKEHEGILLDPALIAKNPGCKAVAKLMLNSFWGKFGQDENKPQTCQLTSGRELLRLMDDPLAVVKEIRILSPEIVEVVYEQHPGAPWRGLTTNIFVAAFTTTMARLKLYESLETVGENALYYDTDSVIYCWKPGQPEIPLGDYLGDMTNELSEGDFITEFVSAGPKNYGYKTRQDKVECKVKGFSLNSSGKEQLNFEVLKSNVKQELEQGTHAVTDIYNPVHFERNPITKKIKTVPQTKSYQLVFDKRIIIPGTCHSIPYGYERE